MPPCAVPVLSAVGCEHGVVGASQRDEVLGTGDFGIAKQPEQPDRLRLALQTNQIEPQAREVGCSGHGRVADDDLDAVGLALAFEPGGDVDRVAEHGVVEALLGAHVADIALAGVDSDADPDRRHPIRSLRLRPR